MTDRVENNYLFEFQKDIEYYIGNVDILSEADLKFRQHLLDTERVEHCNKVYKRIFFGPKAIGTVSNNGVISVVTINQKLLFGDSFLLALISYILLNGEKPI